MSSFALDCSIEWPERLRQMRWNVAHQRVGRLKDPRYHFSSDWALACYGPSLKQTWEKLRGRRVISVSGAHDFLIERGIVPAYHVECDPRPHKAAFLGKPHAATTYLIASCCHPATFERLRGMQVLMWHSGEEPIAEMRAMLREIDPGSKLIGGGSNVGLRALAIASDVLSIRQLDVHGMDCSYAAGDTWAGPHSGSQHIGRFRNRVAGRTFETSCAMFNAALDFLAMLKYTRCDFTLHGDGMLGWILKAVGSENIKDYKDLLHPVDHLVVEVDVPDPVVA